ncbi:hypothetical protein [Leucobacter luti]|uniref:hypothetical protein n=1 Tax=Leucobacter luti TaxID=340320 RepID=UPI003CFE98F6
MAEPLARPLAARETLRRRAAPVTVLTVLHAEWIKYRTLVSYPITTAAVLALIVGMGLLSAFSLVWNADAGQAAGTGAVPALPPGQFLDGMQYAYVVLGILAAVFTASEYTQATMQPSLLAAPKRIPVLAAKAGLMGIAGLVVGALGSAIVLLVAPGLLAGVDLAVGGAPDGIARIIVGSGVSLALMGVLAVGLAALIRSLVAGFITVVVLLTVAPIVLSAVPVEWVAKLMVYLPTVVGSQYLSPDPTATIVDPCWGLVILAGWALAFLVAGGLTLRYRDA